MIEKCIIYFCIGALVGALVGVIVTKCLLYIFG